MRKILFLLSALSFIACDSLYFSAPMPNEGTVAGDFPSAFTGEYRMLESVKDSSFAYMRIAESKPKVYEISFSDSGFFQLGFIIDLKEKRFVEMDTNQEAESFSMELREFKDDYYLSWFKEEVQGWQLLKFDIGRDTLSITIPEFHAHLIQKVKDLDNNDYLATTSDQELQEILKISTNLSFERISEPPLDQDFILLGGIALILLVVFILLSRRRSA